jgi:predicted HAD superfamily Cof-like phosphohydrolase
VNYLTTTDPVALVREFMDKFGSDRNPDLWVKLVEEEAKEVREALTNLVKESCDLIYTMTGLFIACGEDPEKVQWYLDRNIEIMRTVDILYEMTEFDQEMMETAFIEVHLANMSKLGIDGKPVKREDGKVLKGPNYAPADIDTVIRQHYGVE